MDGPPLGLSERERSLIFPNGLAIMQIRGLHSTPRMAHSSSRDPLFHACHDLQCITPTGRGEAIARPSADFGMLEYAVDCAALLRNCIPVTAELRDSTS